MQQAINNNKYHLATSIYQLTDSSGNKQLTKDTSQGFPN
jgi:hypothetical protein